MIGTLEKRWFPAVQSFTSDGTANGTVTVADVTGFYTKQKISLSSSTQPVAALEVKVVLSKTTIKVGKVGTSIDDGTDVSAYLVADGAKITASMQVKPQLQPPEIFNAVYEHDPIVALRSILVDKYGDKFDQSNPIPVSSTPGWDEIDLTYDTDDLLQTVVYKNGTSTTTLTLSYDGDSNLTKVVRT